MQSSQMSMNLHLAPTPCPTLRQPYPITAGRQQITFAILISNTPLELLYLFTFTNYFFYYKTRTNSPTLRDNKIII